MPKQFETTTGLRRRAAEAVEAFHLDVVHIDEKLADLRRRSKKVIAAKPAAKVRKILAAKPAAPMPSSSQLAASGDASSTSSSSDGSDDTSTTDSDDSSSTSSDSFGSMGDLEDVDVAATSSVTNALVPEQEHAADLE